MSKVPRDRFLGFLSAMVIQFIIINLSELVLHEPLHKTIDSLVGGHHLVAHQRQYPDERYQFPLEPNNIR